MSHERFPSLAWGRTLIRNLIQSRELSGRRRSSMTNKPNTSILARTLSGLSLKRRDSETQEEIRGAHGLNLLYSPPEPIVDFIFVHGLGGGSRKTWSKTQDSMSFWPKEWLPRDREFKHVRIHSFGYNSDWGERGQSALHIHDFGKSLLGAISDNAHLRGNKDSPIVFIGHSMGGLVVKKVCTLAQQDPAFQNIRRRIKAIYFLGTPHRGSGLAQTLGNIIRASGYGSKAFVADLHKQSGFLQSINDGFRHCVEGIQLFSFYETRPTNLVVGNEMIVQQDSATLGYPQERTALLNADHRGMTKFDSAEDPNFITVREAFLAVTESIKDDCKYESTSLIRLILTV
jgi:pimeloyl-ACP methyl ester carboxylesterase